jgi:hypothetical protein
MEDKDINDIFRRFSELAAFRAERETVWDDIIAYTDPDAGYVQQEEERGSIRTEHIYDSTANKNLNRLAATLNSMLTGQFTKWFKLETTDEEFNKDSAGKEWLEEVNEILLGVFDNSNFYVQVFKFYYDLCNIGTGTMYIEEDTKPDKEVRFSTRHIREIYFAEDKYGDVDTVFRKSKMSLRQMVQRWGLDKLSKKSKQIYEKSPDKRIDILHCVYPRDDYDPEQKKSTKMAYASYWFEYDGKHELDESGYEELPYSVARWFTPSAEIYGRGPMYTALPDIRSLNRMMKITIEGSELAVRPPLKGTPDLWDYQDSINLESDSVIIVDRTRSGDLKPVWEPKNLAISFEMMQVLREQITDVLLGNQLATIDKTQMTAAEVNARMSENSKVIGPTFGRIQTEFLEKLIERVYSVVLRQVDADGKPKIPEPPISPDGDIKIKFVSPLAKAQRSNEIQGILSTIEWALSVAEAFPQVLDLVDIDEALRIFADTNDAPPEMIVDEDLVAQVRQQRVQQQQAMQQQQMAMIQEKEQAENMNKVAGADKNRAEAEQTREGE